MEEQEVNSAVTDEVQINAEHLYLTQDSEGQIIFVVNPDQQFTDEETGQVVYIETQDGITDAQTLLQGTSSVQVVPQNSEAEQAGVVPLEVMSSNVADGNGNTGITDDIMRAEQSPIVDVSLGDDAKVDAENLENESFAPSGDKLIEGTDSNLVIDLNESDKGGVSSAKEDDSTKDVQNRSVGDIPEHLTDVVASTEKLLESSEKMIQNVEAIVNEAEIKLPDEDESAAKSVETEIDNREVSASSADQNEIEPDLQDRLANRENRIDGIKIGDVPSTENTALQLDVDHKLSSSKTFNNGEAVPMEVDQQSSVTSVELAGNFTSVQTERESLSVGSNAADDSSDAFKSDDLKQTTAAKCLPDLCDDNASKMNLSVKPNGVESAPTNEVDASAGRIQKESISSVVDSANVAGEDDLTGDAKAEKSKIMFFSPQKSDEIVIISPAKVMSSPVKPMPEGPFILHEDDFEMDDVDDSVGIENPDNRPNGTNTPKNFERTSNSSSTEYKQNGDIDANIFDKINNRLIDRQDQSKNDNPKSDGVAKQDEPVSQDAESNSSKRRSHRSRRAPDKFEASHQDEPTPPKRISEMNGPTSQKRKLQKLPCKMYIRYQNSYTQAQSSIYRCYTCHFTTARLDNIVRHHKQHILENNERKKMYDATNNPQKNRSDSDDDDGRREIDKTDEISQTKSASSQQDDNMIDSEDDDDDDDDDNDLPPAFSSPLKNGLPYKVDDVVWATWRKLYWPAVVMRIFLNRKTVDVMVIDSPFKQTYMKLPFSRIVQYVDVENDKIIENQLKRNIDAKNFKGALDKASDYLRRRGMKLVQTAAQYFGLENLDVTDNASANSFSSVPDKQDLNDDDDDEQNDETIDRSSLSNSFDDESDDISIKIKKRQEERKTQNKTLIEIIVAGHLDEHLIGIYNQSIKCDKNELFHCKTASERSKLKRMYWFGPIDNDDQQLGIIDYVMQLVTRRCIVSKTFDIYSYVFEVLVPEVITKAIQKVRRISEKRAREIFDQGISWSKEELDAIHRNTFENIVITPEQREEHRLRMMNFMRKISGES